MNAHGARYGLYSMLAYVYLGRYEGQQGESSGLRPPGISAQGACHVIDCMAC